MKNLLLRKARHTGSRCATLGVILWSSTVSRRSETLRVISHAQTLIHGERH